MSAYGQTIEVREGETVIKRFSPPEETNVTGMTWALKIASRWGDSATRTRTSGDGLSINNLTGDVDWTIDETDTVVGEYVFELERTNAGAVRVVADGFLIVSPGVE